MTTPSLGTSIEELLEQAAAEGRGFETGRYLVTYRPGAREDAVKSMRSGAAIRSASAADFESGAVDFDGLSGAQSLVLPELDVAVVSAHPDERGALESMVADSSNPIEAVEPETFVFHQGADWREYLRGFAAAADRIQKDLGGGGGEPAPAPGGGDPDEEAAVAGVTWGLAATRAAASPLTGRGIRVAVLDTGMDFRHPDFVGRAFASATFIPGQPAQDGHGHGTHCIGTACGPRAPAGRTPRYGIASEAQIFVGKVLSNTGSSVGGSVLAGMNWAIQNRCAVISMSLGGPGGPFVAYTQAGQAALNAGCLIVAAAGNDSRRPGFIAPTGSPANSPTIMAVAALDERLGVAPFSNGGKIEIAGPGVNVFSSWPMPMRYRTISGTSMATPHVAGIAALYAQSNPGLRGRALWSALVARARRLPLPPRDVGAGLVQAP